MRLALGLLLSISLHAATITITHTDDAGKVVSTSTITTSDAVLQAFSTQMAVQITRMMERQNQAAGGRGEVAPAVPPTVSEIVKAIVMRGMPRPVTADPKLKALMDQMTALQAQIKAAQDALVK